MNAHERAETIKKIRSQEIEGSCVFLVPATELYAEKIVELRNRPRVRSAFNQTSQLTVYEQCQWFAEYKKTDNDIYWCVLNRKRHFIGTIRLYGIDLNGEICEEGSFAIDESASAEAPYAVDAKIMTLDIAFRELEIQKVINLNRCDNKAINNLDNQLGFDAGTVVKVRGVDFFRRILEKENYNKNRMFFSSLVEYWTNR